MSENAPTSTPRKRFGSLVLCLLIGFFAAFLFLFPTSFRRIDKSLYKLELMSRDFRMGLRKPRPLDDRIVVVGLTDLEHFLYGSQIESREAYVVLLQELRKMGARAVLFDILFEHTKPMDSALSMKLQEIPSYLSYKFLTEDLPLRELGESITRQRMDELLTTDFPTSDTGEICEAIQEHMDMVDILAINRLKAYQSFEDEKVRRIDQQIVMNRFQLHELSRQYFQKTYGLPDFIDPDVTPSEGKFVRLPSESLLLTASGHGFINLMKTEEDVVRKVPLFIRYGERLYPHLDLVFICDYYGVELKDMRIVPGRYVEIRPTKNYEGVKRIPVDKSGYLTINFLEGDPFLRKNSFSLQQVLHYARYGKDSSTRIRPERFRDAIVIVGELNPGGADVEPIPILPAFPMVGIHATIINMILHDDYIKDLGRGWTVGLTIFFGLLMGMVFSFTEYKTSSLIAALLFIIYTLTAIFAFSRFNVYIPYVTPAGAIILSYVFLIFYSVGIKDREKRKVKDIFLKSVSPHIGEEILRHYDNQAIWGSKKDVTVFFVDIRGFTLMAESMEAMDLVEVLDAYYDTVSDIIFRHDGVVNKFIGDAVMALFGAPLDLPNKELNAIKSAREVRKACAELSDHPIMKKYRKKLGVGIGVSSGEVIVGTVGKKRIRIEYTALGDTVNVAERLQGIARPGEILINKLVCERLREYRDEELKDLNLKFEKLPPVSLKGKEQNVSVYRVIFGEDSVPAGDKKS